MGDNELPLRIRDSVLSGQCINVAPCGAIADGCKVYTEHDAPERPDKP